MGVELVVNDLRRGLSRKRACYAKKLLGIEVEIVECDATELHRLGVKAGIAPMHELTAPHFEELDRVYGLLCRVGFKEVTVERATEDEIVVTMGAGYDVRKGTLGGSQ